MSNKIQHLYIAKLHGKQLRALLLVEMMACSEITQCHTIYQSPHIYVLISFYIIFNPSFLSVLTHTLRPATAVKSYHLATLIRNASMSLKGGMAFESW